MNLDLAVIGRGAVSPAGIGVAALRSGEPVPTSAPELRRPELTWPVLRVDQKTPELQRWQREPRLRRASPITLFLIETAEQALAGLTADERARTGLIISYSAGCLAYSRRFFEGIVTEGRNLASPALFPETVFNAPGSHVAAALKLNGAAYALVGDETAWVAALQTAAIWLREERVERVLVLGADEFDSLALDAYACSRWLRRSPKMPSLLPSEGAGGLLLRAAQPGDAVRIAAARDGYTYRTAREAAAAARRLFATIDSQVPCYRTAQGTWLGSLEQEFLRSRETRPTEKLPPLGQAFTASAAWNLLRALDELAAPTPALALPLWGLNHQLGIVHLERSI